jgi:3alpha(or 20beta)-hydroxysteroid dehydrogenase
VSRPAADGAGRLAGRVALVTGAARGQGEAEARLFAAEGAQVVLTDVLDELGEKVAAGIGDNARYVHHDVSSEDDWRRVIDEVRSTEGALHVLVNNAGIVRDTPILTTSLEQYLEVININQVGVFLGMREAAPLLRDSGGGSIVNVSSMMGIVGGAPRVAYVSSKFAVRGITKAAAAELGPLGIRVNSIHPGAIDTPFIAPGTRDRLPVDRLPLRRIGTAEEVAKLALFLASDDSSYSTGCEFVIDGGWLAAPLV